MPCAFALRYILCRTKRPMTNKKTLRALSPLWRGKVQYNFLRNDKRRFRVVFRFAGKTVESCYLFFFRPQLASHFFQLAHAVVYS